MIHLVVFLMVLEIFNDESANSTFKNKLEYKFEYKLGGFNTWELVPDIIDYKLEFMMQKLKNFSLIKLHNFYDNDTSLFFTQFNLNLVIKFFSMICCKNR